jgi:predicted transcriptional regulator
MNKESLKFLDVFDLKPVPKKVLLDILRNGDSSVASIASRLNMPKSTIYDALSPLMAQSLINEYSGDRGKTFGISDNEQLIRVHADKMEELKKAHLSLISFIQNHKTESTVSQPKIKFYSGILGIKQAFRDMPWVKEHTESFLFWPVRDMIDNIGEEFFKWHGVQRFKHQVFLYCIEKHTDRKLQQNLNKEWLHINKKNLVKARYLPKGTDVKMSYWIYGDKVLFASGGTEKIAFTVHSKEFSQLMKIMWQNTWDNSKE